MLPPESVDAELRQVALQEGLQELTPPGQRIPFGTGRVGQRETATQPVPAQGLRAQIVKRNPSNGTVSSRPASVSDDCRSSSGEALPRIKNRAGRGRRSASTRRSGNNPADVGFHR